MSDPQVASHMRVAVSDLSEAMGNPVRIVVCDRLGSVAARRFADSAESWGAQVVRFLGDRHSGESIQEFGDSCGYNSPVDLVAFLRDLDGAWWRGWEGGWVPHQ
eukprot:gene8378-5437_t